MARVYPHYTKIVKLFNLIANPKWTFSTTFNVKIALSKYRSHRELLQIDYRKWSSIVCVEYYSSVSTIGAKNEWFRHVNEINMKKRQNRTIFFSFIKNKYFFLLLLLLLLLISPFALLPKIFLNSSLKFSILISL